MIYIDICILVFPSNWEYLKKQRCARLQAGGQKFAAFSRILVTENLKLPLTKSQYFRTFLKGGNQT